MSEEDKNRVVVTDDTGEATHMKTDAEIVKENEELEESLKPKVEALDPNILKKLKEKKENKMNAQRDRSLYFGVVGLGQAGSRLSEIFYKLGYNSCVFNTARQDLEHINLPDNRKIFLPFALGGAGKELDNGRQAVEQNGETILNKINEFFDDSQEMLILAVSGGGGTGSGGAESMIGLMSSLGKPIGVIYVLPMESEDALSKHNSVVTLSKLAKMASSDIITTLIVVDNSKIDLIYPNLSKAEFWNTANNAIIEPIHIFNHLSAISTPHDSLDSMDFGRLFTEGDCTIYGQLDVENYMETTAIAEAIIENLESGLLASDFNLKETRFAGFIITASKEVLDKLPAVTIDYAQHMLSDICDFPQMVRGVYEIESDDDVVHVYTMLSGLGLPTSRIDSLKEEAQKQMSLVKEKQKNRNSNMTIDYNGGNETKAQVDEVHRMIKQKNSGFGKLTNNANKSIKDRRKR